MGINSINSLHEYLDEYDSSHTVKSYNSYLGAKLALDYLSKHFPYKMNIKELHQAYSASYNDLLDWLNEKSMGKFIFIWPCVHFEEEDNMLLMKLTWG